MVGVQGICIGVEIPAAAWITCLGKLRMITWNLRAMLGGRENMARQREKIENIRYWMERYDIIFLQEVHGADAALELFKHEAKIFEWIGTFCDNPRAGGPLWAFASRLSKNIVQSGGALLFKGEGLLLRVLKSKIIASKWHLCPFTFFPGCMLKISRTLQKQLALTSKRRIGLPFYWETSILFTMGKTAYLSAVF